MINNDKNVYTYMYVYWGQTWVASDGMLIGVRRLLDRPVVKDLVRFRVWGSGFMVQGSGSRAQGSGFRVQGSDFSVWGSGFRVQGLGFRVEGLRLGVH